MNQLNTTAFQPIASDLVAKALGCKDADVVSRMVKTFARCTIGASTAVKQQSILNRLSLERLLFGQGSNPLATFIAQTHQVLLCELVQARTTQDTIAHPQG